MRTRAILALAFSLVASVVQAQWIRQSVTDKMDDSRGVVFATFSDSKTLTLLIDCRPPANGRMSLGSKRPFSIAHAHNLVMSTRVRIDQGTPKNIGWTLSDATFAFRPTPLIGSLDGATTLRVEVTYAGGDVVVEKFNVTGAHACPAKGGAR